MAKLLGCDGQVSLILVAAGWPPATGTWKRPHSDIFDADSLVGAAPLITGIVCGFCGGKSLIGGNVGYLRNGQWSLFCGGLQRCRLPRFFGCGLSHLCRLQHDDCPPNLTGMPWVRRAGGGGACAGADRPGLALDACNLASPLTSFARHSLDFAGQRCLVHGILILALG